MKLSIDDVSIRTIERVYPILLESLNQYADDETLDCSEVVSIDMCGIQLLISFGKSLQKQGHTLKLTSLCPSLLSSIRLSGCAEVLGVANE